MVKQILKAQIENIKNALLQSFTLTMKKTGNNKNLVLLIILQQTIGCSKMVSICKVKIFFTVHLHKEKHKGIFHHSCHKTKKLSKLGPIFMCSYSTDDIEAHVEVRN
jgi:hypothetical protein